jgi:hypothetical protein
MEPVPKLTRVGAFTAESPLGCAPTFPSVVVVAC